MAKTFNEIVRVTPQKIRDYSVKCRAVRQGKSVIEVQKPLGLVLNELYYVKGTTNTYKVRLMFMPSKRNEQPTKDKNSPLWVTCDCAFFLYNCEVALARAGSSSVIHSNGKRPVVTNPKLIPYVCKHVYRAMFTATSTYRTR